MQYVGQTKRKLKERFREHFNKMKKPKKKLILFSTRILLELEGCWQNSMDMAYKGKPTSGSGTSCPIDNNVLW